MHSAKKKSVKGMYTCIHSVKAHSVYIQYVYIHTFSKFPFSMLRRAFTEWRALTECMFTARAGLLVLAHHLDQVGSPDHSVVSDDASLSLSLSLSLYLSLSLSLPVSLSLSHTHTRCGPPAVSHWISEITQNSKQSENLGIGEAEAPVKSGPF